MGSAETVPLIKIVDLKQFQAQRFAKDNLVVSVVGDLTADVLGKLLDSVFGSLPETASPWKLPDTIATAGNRTIVIDKPIPQSVIRFGQSGIKRSDPEFFAAYIMNYVLGGGGFESRLYREIREKRGLHTLSILTSPRIDTLDSLWAGPQLQMPGQPKPLKS